MGYIGKDPADSFISFVKQDFSVSATTSYTLDNAVTNENEIALFINHVRQEPTTAYTASGTSLTLTSATSSGDDMYCVYLGMAKQTVNAPDGSVGNSQVASTIITGQTAETSIATDDTVLIHDTSAGALRKMTRANFVSGVGETNKPAFLATMSAQSVADNTYTKLAFATEVVDTNSAYDHSTNYRFTVPSGEGGVYYFTAMMQSGGMVTNSRAQIVFAKNGSRDSTTMARDYAPTNSLSLYCTASSILSLSASDYVEVQMLQASGSTQDAGYGQFGGFKVCSV
jgi:hypothetical protein